MRNIIQNIFKKAGKKSNFLNLKKKRDFDSEKAYQLRERKPKEKVDMSMINCHHCSKIKLLKDMVICSNDNCRESYCKNCLKNYYHMKKFEDLTEWICFKCQGLCKCERCRPKNEEQFILKKRKYKKKNKFTGRKQKPASQIKNVIQVSQNYIVNNFTIVEIHNAHNKEDEKKGNSREIIKACEKHFSNVTKEECFVCHFEYFHATDLLYFEKGEYVMKYIEALKKDKDTAVFINEYQDNAKIHFNKPKIVCKCCFLRILSKKYFTEILEKIFVDKEPDSNSTHNFVSDKSEKKTHDITDSSKSKSKVSDAKGEFSNPYLINERNQLEEESQKDLQRYQGKKGKYEKKTDKNETDFESDLSKQKCLGTEKNTLDESAINDSNPIKTINDPKPYQELLSTQNDANSCPKSTITKTSNIFNDIFKTPNSESVTKEMINVPLFFSKDNIEILCKFGKILDETVFSFILYLKRIRSEYSTSSYTQEKRKNFINHFTIWLIRLNNLSTCFQHFFGELNKSLENFKKFLYSSPFSQEKELLLQFTNEEKIFNCNKQLFFDKLNCLRKFLLHCNIYMNN